MHLRGGVGEIDEIGSIMKRQLYVPLYGCEVRYEAVS